MRRHRIERRSGFSLMTVLVALAVVTALAVAMIQQLARQKRQAIMREEQVQCYWIAESEWRRIQSVEDSPGESGERRTIDLSVDPPRRAVVAVGPASNQDQRADVVISVTMYRGERVIIREAYTWPLADTAESTGQIGENDE